MKFCRFVASVSFFPFQVSCFNKSDSLDFIANDEWPKFTLSQSTGLSGLGAMLEIPQQKPKLVPKFSNAL